MTWTASSHRIRCHEPLNTGLRSGGPSILLTERATGEWWQLGPLPPPDGAFLLIGWAGEDNDGALPSAITRTLAQALVRVGRVTFPCSTVGAPEAGWHARGTEYVTALPEAPAPGLVRGVLGRLNPARKSQGFRLLSTVQPRAVHGLFDDAEYPWWLQGQFALLSPITAGPPDLAPHAALLGTLVEPEWTNALAGLQPAGIAAIVRPGVDGNVAGVHCASTEIRGALEHALQEAGATFGVTCHVLSESAFASALG